MSVNSSAVAIVNISDGYTRLVKSGDMTHETARRNLNALLDHAEDAGLFGAAQYVAQAIADLPTHGQVVHWSDTLEVRRGTREAAAAGPGQTATDVEGLSLCSLCGAMDRREAMEVGICHRWGTVRPWTVPSLEENMPFGAEDVPGCQLDELRPDPEPFTPEPATPDWSHLDGWRRPASAPEVQGPSGPPIEGAPADGGGEEEQPSFRHGPVQPTPPDAPADGGGEVAGGEA